ncbi:hypothetical protein EMCRGX_G010845 [Ephydatia muelleri]
MCTIRRIDKLLPVDGADKIECAVIGGWNVIVKKGEFKEGELALYFEIDSWVPHDLAPFLTSEGKEPREYEGVKGERLKSKKIRKVVSQGLLLTLSGFLSNDPAYVSQEGTCLDSVLNVKKWDNDDTPTCDRESEFKILGRFSLPIKRPDTALRRRRNCTALASRHTDMKESLECAREIKN